WAMRIVAGRMGVDPAGTTVDVTRRPWGRLDLRFYLPRGLSADERAPEGAVMVAAESLLGEQAFHQWIGGIDVARQGRLHWLSFGPTARNDVPLRELPAVAGRHVAH